MLLLGLRDARGVCSPLSTECLLKVCCSSSVKHVSRAAIFMYFVSSALVVTVAGHVIVLAELLVMSDESVNISCKL